MCTGVCDSSDDNYGSENYQSPTWWRSTIKIMVDTEWAALEEVPFSDGLTRRWSQINSTFYISQNDINVYMTYYRLEHILMFQHWKRVV